MYDEDPVMDSDDKCAVCQMSDLCTKKKKNAGQCFDARTDEAWREYLRLCSESA